MLKFNPLESVYSVLLQEVRGVYIDGIWEEQAYWEGHRHGTCASRGALRSNPMAFALCLLAINRAFRFNP
jgi:hypothetical protein